MRRPLAFVDALISVDRSQSLTRPYASICSHSLTHIYSSALSSAVFDSGRFARRAATRGFDKRPKRTVRYCVHLFGSAVYSLAARDKTPVGRGLEPRCAGPSRKDGHNIENLSKRTAIWGGEPGALAAWPGWARAGNPQNARGRPRTAPGVLRVTGARPTWPRRERPRFSAPDCCPF